VFYGENNALSLLDRGGCQIRIQVGPMVFLGQLLIMVKYHSSSFFHSLKLLEMPLLFI